MQNLKKTRITWLDTAKGFGIILTVIAHILDNTIVSKFIFIFHMPLFFFISGYLYKKDYSQIKKTIHLLVPYFAFLIIIYPLQVLRYYKDDLLSNIIFRFIYGGTMLEGWTGVFWFITCFFICQYLFHKILSLNNPKIIISIFISSLLLAYINYFYFQKISFPWAINICFYALPIMFTGFVYKINLENKLKNYTLILFLSLIVIAVILFFSPSISIVMKSAIYGIPILSFICGIILIHIIIVTSKFICNKLILLSLPIIYIGKASMIIMYLHQFIQFIIRDYLTENIYVRILFAILIPLISYFILNKFRITRFIFIGSVNEFKSINNLIKRT